MGRCGHRMTRAAHGAHARTGDFRAEMTPRRSRINAQPLRSGFAARPEKKCVSDEGLSPTSSTSTKETSQEEEAHTTQPHNFTRAHTHTLAIFCRCSTTAEHSWDSRSTVRLPSVSMYSASPPTPPNRWGIWTSTASCMPNWVLPTPGVPQTLLIVVALVVMVVVLALEVVGVVVLVLALLLLLLSYKTGHDQDSSFELVTAGKKGGVSWSHLKKPHRTMGRWSSQQSTTDLSTGRMHH